MTSRDPREPHRASTPLELLFDLCFVAAVAQAASELHHGLAAGQLASALLAYALVFFAIWWAWMGFTWFASAYDTDDVPYRLQVLVQIAGVLVIAASVPRAFEDRDFSGLTIGYSIMRVGLVGQWLRAASQDARGRRTALRYALGVSLCQIGWLLLLALPHERWLLGWLVLAPAELAVPVWAERSGATSWHAQHIAERYGLLALIVLGESATSATLAIQSAVDTGAASLRLAGLIGGALLIFFSMWWIYFDQPAQRLLVSNRSAFLWGYGHLGIFASTAAVGAGLGVCTDVLSGRAQLSEPAASASVAIPVALYVLGVWALQIRPLRRGRPTRACLAAAAALVATPALGPAAVPAIGALLAALVALQVAWSAPPRAH